MKKDLYIFNDNISFVDTGKVNPNAWVNTAVVGKYRYSHDGYYVYNECNHIYSIYTPDDIMIHKMLIIEWLEHRKYICKDLDGSEWEMFIKLGGIDFEKLNKTAKENE